MKYHNINSGEFEADAKLFGKEVTCYTVAVPNLAGTIPGTFKPHMIKDSRKLLRYVKELDGFIGVHPVPPKGTLLIFDTENNAKRARNLISNDLKVQCGNNICRIFIPESDIKEGGNCGK